MQENSVELDELDRRILDIIQGEFPLISKPYARLGSMLGVKADTVFERVERMRENGVIRRLGANFQSGKLGCVSTLCAARVKPEELEMFVKRVNAEIGVTHNYERDHEWNIWFTLIAPDKGTAEKILSSIESDTGVKILNLPATCMYKIRVDFPMGEEERPEPVS